MRYQGNGAHLRAGVVGDAGRRAPLFTGRSNLSAPPGAGPAEGGTSPGRFSFCQVPCCRFFPRWELGHFYLAQ